MFPEFTCFTQALQYFFKVGTGQSDKMQNDRFESICMIYFFEYYTTTPI